MKSRLARPGFLSLLLTQFLGAVNDNILKGVLIYMVIDGTWAGKLGSGGQGIVSVCFTLPFILLSGYAGQVCDRNSKQFVSVIVKIVELPIAMIGLIGFWVGNLWTVLAALIALGCQSAFFGPAKYGMIPELVESRDLSRANGTINMATNVAVIVGTLAAGLIADAYSPQTSANGKLWLPGTAMVLIAIAGLAAVMFLPRLAPGDQALQYQWNPFATYISVMKETAGAPLQLVMFAWGYFYFLAGLALLIIPEYSVVLEPFGVARAEVSVLLGVMGVAVGVGSALAGWISGHAIRPRLIPIGAAGLALFFLLLAVVPPYVPNLDKYWRILLSPISWFIAGAGVSAGFYILPLQALIQRLSPDGERGRFLGTANCISFCFLLLSSLLYWIIRPAFGAAPNAQHPEKIFLVCSLMTMGGAGLFLWRMKVRGLSFAKLE